MPVSITAQGLRTVAPGASDAIVAGILSFQAYFDRYGIDSNPRVSGFLAMAACETVGLTRLEENLYYTTASRLRAVWPSRFSNAAAAEPYLRNPEKLANAVYGGRLGNDKAGDGWRFRGSGVFQSTGRANFAIVEKETGLPVVEHPEMLREFPTALEAAGIFWKVNRLNRFADAGDIVGLTKAVQGGIGGLADRHIYLDRALRVNWIAGSAPEAPAPDPILRKGMKGDAVRQAQKLLAAHYDIRVDGDFGFGTDHIVREFQEDHGLLADGVIGRSTWTALKSASRRTSP